MAIELARFNKSFNDDDSLRHLLLYPKHSSFLAALYRDKTFDVRALLEGGTQYLVKNDDSDNRYDLKLVSSNALGNGRSTSMEFFTLNKNGITYTFGKETDFMTIEQYESEHTGFHKIKNIRFFKIYRKWKNFTFWKKNVRNAKIQSAKKALNKHLFILSSEFAPTLLKISKYGSLLFRTSLLSIDLKDDTYTLTSFQDAQEEQRKIIHNGIAKFTEQVHTEMVSICETSLKTFLELNGFPQTGGPRNDADSISDTSEDEEQAITFTERAAMRTQCRRLLRFIRMVDYIVMGVHVSLSVDSTISYLNRLRQQNDVMFEINVLLKNTQLTFSPLPDEFKGTLDMYMFDSLRIAATPIRLLTCDEFDVYAQPFIDEYGQIGTTADVETIMMSNPNFRMAVAEINKRISQMFVNANTAIKQYHPFLKDFLDNVNVMKGMIVENYANHTIEELLDRLDYYRKQELYFEDDIPKVLTTGLIKINASMLFQTFRPSPSDCLNKLMRSLLPDLADTKNQKALDEIQERNNTISASPLDVQHLVDLREYLDATNERMYDLEDECMHVMKFFKMMEDQQIEITEELSSKNFMMYQLKSSLSVSITKLEDQMSNHMEYFGQELKDNIAKLKDVIRTTYDFLQDEKFSSSKSNLNEIVELLSKTHENLQEIVRNVETYTQQQDALGYIVAEYDNLPRLKTDLKLKKQLWDALFSWTKKTAGWLNEPFETVDPFIIEKEVQKYFKVAISSGKKLPGSDVPQLLRTRVEDFKLTMPVVNDLRTKDLQTRHWNKIHALVGYDINGIEGITCGVLIERRIMEHADKINEIALEAINEAILEEMLLGVVGLWKRKSLKY